MIYGNYLILSSIFLILLSNLHIKIYTATNTINKNNNNNNNKQEKANIIFLMTDSMSGEIMDPMSPISKTVEMTHLRNLASYGTNFIRTYSNSPQCVPSRTSMFTGRHVNEIASWSNQMGLAGNVRKKSSISSSSSLNNNNNNNNNNKMGIDSTCLEFYDEIDCQQFAKRQNVTSTIYDEMIKYGYNISLIGKVDVGNGINIKEMSDIHPYMTNTGFHTGSTLGISTRSANILKRTKQDPMSITNDNATKEGHPQDWMIADHCIDYLNTIKNTNKKKKDNDNNDDSNSNNFMLYCSINIPHPNFITNQTWLKYVNKSAITIPKMPRLNDMHPYDSYMSKTKAMDRNFTNDDILKVRSTYYGMNAEADHILGTIIDAAYKNNYTTDNTYFIYLSDHGEMNMDHRQIWKDSMYESSSRVPMIIAGPGIKKNNIVYDIISLLDVFPTLIEMTGINEIPSYLSGSSLFPLMELKSNNNNNLLWKNYTVSQFHSNTGNTGSFMIRYGDYKLITFGNFLNEYRNYKSKLYNLKVDPEERYNLVDKEIEIYQEMKKLLYQELGDINLIDKEVKLQDYYIYMKYFELKMDKDQLRSKFENTYHKFDDNDYEKIENWKLELEEYQQININVQ